MKRFMAIAACTLLACGQERDSPQPPAEPAAPVLSVTAAPVLSVTAAPEPAPAPAEHSRWRLSPPKGQVVARGRFQPRITTGTSGVILAHAAPTDGPVPVYASRSECDWSESVVALTWAQLAGQASPTESATPPCSTSRASFRPYLGDLQYEPLAIRCEIDKGYRCHAITLGHPEVLPDFGLDARLGAPRLVDYYANYLGPELKLGILGAQLVGNKLTSTATRVGDKPTSSVLVDSVSIPCDSPDDCHLSIVPWEKDAVTVELVHRNGMKLEMRMDERGRPVGKPAISRETSGDPTRSGPLAIDGTGRLVRRYHVGRDIDAPLEGGVGHPVTSFQQASEATADGNPALALAWIEGERPNRRLRLGRIPVTISYNWHVEDPILDVAQGDLGTVSISGLAGKLTMAWSEREGDIWIVRAAELSAAPE